MKYIILLLVFSFTNNTSFGQTPPPVDGGPATKLEQLYFSFGKGAASDFTNQQGSAFGINTWLMLSNNWGIDIGFRDVAFDAYNTPSDWRGGLCLWGPCINPQIYNHLWMFNITREKLTSSRDLKWVLEAGLGYYTQEDITFSPHIDPPQVGESFNLDVSSNYDQAINTHFNYGLTLRADAEVPLSGAFGFNFSAYSFIYSKGIFAGMDIMIMLGKVGPHRSKRYLKRHPGYVPVF
ncbi:MAG: hypothetical protein H0X33_02995 [Taibaiella sp.]|nr:hypothetical protein [Taibaiella sp.]